MASNEIMSNINVWKNYLRNAAVIKTEHLLPEVINIALEAGRAIKDIYLSPDFSVTTKADNSPLTQADLAAHQIICDELAELMPGLPILSEESSAISTAERLSWTRFWLVDPLDGTKEFIKRNDEFTVNIALIDHGVPVLGVVYAPMLDVCYFAAEGFGAWVQRNQSTATQLQMQERKPADKLRVMVSRSHMNSRTQALLSHLGEHECIAMGSSLKHCLVAEGLADFYPRLGPTMEWDTAASHAVVKFAGGRVCDLTMQELKYNKPDLLNPDFLVLGKPDPALLQSIRSAL